ncbi:hypothetical protein OF001_U40227 [Pseudomonas sp. OF001]|nr:hypothetical protein [Pseudomonas sp. OF001]CAD5379029.1 hypothetical protein OF001_U40227 [Pseudomonas sp. OF001]
MSEQKKTQPAEPEIQVITEVIRIPLPGGGVVQQKRERVVMRRR